MGYATIFHVRPVDATDHYQQVHNRWENTKPIRGGADDNVRPLGQRRDVREYSVTKNVVTGGIVYRYCQRAVMTFMPSGEVVVADTPHGFGAHQFITRVLGIPAYTKNGETILEVSGVKRILPNKGDLRLVKGSDGNWQTDIQQINHGYKINRKKYAAVKANYKEFEQFFHAFMSVQKMRNIPTSQYDRAEYMVVKLIPSVMMEIFGSVEAKPFQIPNRKVMINGQNEIVTKYADVVKYIHMMNKPFTQSRYIRSGETKEYYDSAKAVEELINSNQSEETKHGNFVKGAFLFCMAASSFSFYSDDEDRPTYAHHDRAIRLYNDFALYLFAEQVVDLVQLPDGKLPNPKLEKVMKMHQEGAYLP